MLRFLYKTRTRRIISCYLLISLFTEILYPTAALALTAGPSTPEVQSFEPISTSEMVDIFTGDFKYNIPLMDVGGYPVNIAYNSGISSDQEASWVGLGWNLNVGNISRGMRGIPDDFDGTDIVRKEFNMKPNRTYGINAGFDFELFGYVKTKKPGTKKKLKFTPRVGVGLNYNNYTGFGVETSVSCGISAGVGSKGTLDASLGLHSSNTGGLDISPNISYSHKNSKKIEDQDYLVKKGGGSLGGTFNTRAGLKQLTFTANYSKTIERKGMMYMPSTNGIIPDMIPTSETVAQMCGGGSGSSINFGLQTYVPHINMPMLNNSISLSIKMGATIFGVDGNLTLSGYYASQKLASNNLNLKAYGYLYSEKGQGNPGAMMDFNREKDGAFSRFTKNLPITNFTYDVYSASGQGVGGTFRPFRHDVGHVFDNSSSNLSDSYSLGGELDGGNLTKAGLDITIVDVVNTTQKWSQGNKALNYFQFKDKSVTQLEDETYYFRSVGEKTADNSNASIYSALGADDPWAIKLAQGGSNSANITAEKAIVQWETPSGSSLLLNGSNSYTSRQKRNQNFSTLTFKEAKDFGLQKAYYDGTSGVVDLKGQNPAKAYIAPSGTPNSHHIAEITVLNQDGNRYVYGLPAYNTLQKEVSFNTGQTVSQSNGFVTYTSTDASISNSQGIDNNFNSTTVPAYAHSYLLTAVVSADYVDVTGNGPSEDDLGTYTKFHYKKSVGTSSSNYRWRTPTAASGNALANYSEGSKLDPYDQSASYNYGEKELWFLDEIETKNYIAIFETSNRTDALGVTGEHGAVDQNSAKNQRLDKITLYSKPDYKNWLLNSTQFPVPIKVVNFVYDYSLCGSTPNSSSGKLTLKSVYFTYGKSDRAKFNSYDFTYATNLANPSYHPKAYDRWGNYKPESPVIDYSATYSSLTNGEFPYTDQTQSSQDVNAQAWHLKKISLPTGGEINVEYESDDYAFIQNYPAGQMFQVIGSSVNTPGTDINPVPSVGSFANLYTASSNIYTNNLYLIVNGISPACTTSTQFKNYYLKDINNGAKKMFFKFLVNLKKNSVGQNYYEYISGYADISPTDYGILPNGQAYIKLIDVNLKRQNSNSNDNINPIALAAMQYGRLNHGNTVWDASMNPPGDVEEALKQLANSAFGSLKTMITGFKNPNKALADKEYCHEFITGKSMVRLYNGTGKKLGGGSRVSTLELVDNWSTMTTSGGASQDNTSYKQKYTYTKTDEFGRTISSGVASYEPLIGGEDNPMKQPLYFGSNKWTMMAPDDRYFTESPYGESFFPSPSVGYDCVKIENVYPAAVNVATDYKNGYKVYEFYTTKDYPTITESTPIIPKQHRPPLGGLIKIHSRDFIYTSQGFIVKTNDMHGKLKAELDYAQNGSLVKETRFFYKTKNGGYSQPLQRDLYTDASYSGNELDNNCKVIAKDGTVNTKPIGIDFDAIADFRESETTTTHVGSQNNLASFLVSVIPALVGTVWPTYNQEISRFRSAVLTKVVNQYGILETTQVKENGSIVESINTAFDSETGDALVTKTKNAFSDDIYSLKYPAHWGYDMMGQAYKNQGITVTGTWSGNTSNITNASAYLNVGDEVGIFATSGSVRAWVCSVSGSSAQFIDVNGQLLQISGSNVQIKVLRSARRNLLNDRMSSLTSMADPLPSNPSTPINITASTKVLNASSVLYSDRWQMPKGVINTSNGTNCSCSISQTGTDLLNVLMALFNRPRNALSPQSSYINAFFNGVVDPPLNNTTQPMGVFLQQGTLMYLVANSGYSQFTGFSTGFLGSPCPGGVGTQQNWCNYGLTPNLQQQLPSFYAGQYAPIVGWAGPGKTPGSSPFNANNQLIGYFMTDDPRCYVTIDFGSTNPWIVPGFPGWIKMLAYNNYPGNSASSQGTSVSLVPNSSQTFCSGNTISCTFKIYQTINSSNVYFQAPVTISSSCLNTLLSGCTGPNGSTTYQCGKLPGELVNPFVQGLKGNWRPKISYSYLTARSQNINASTGNTDTRADGYFAAFSPFYAPNGNSWSINTNNWTNTVETTKYNQFGIEIENKDALGRFSSSIYGYNESLPVAVASNAQLREIAFDGFEDYGFYPTNCNRESHFNFSNSIFMNQAALDATYSHTGKYSLKVLNNNTASINKKVSQMQQSTTQNTNPNCAYLLADNDFIYPFSPVSQSSSFGGVLYVVSYWIKQDITGLSSAPLNYINSSLVIKDAGGFPLQVQNIKRSPIIDGWQKEEYTVIIPTNYSGNISLNLQNTSGKTTYFDDIRIHPYTSNMKSFVYHPTTLKYVAELDVNNYATFYEYDDQGNLIRVKKETEKGVMTIQESKTHSRKQ